MKNKGIKVYLQYPWRVSDSQYYKSLVKNPPEGIEYLNAKQKTGTILNAKKFRYFDNFKRVIKYLLDKIPLPIPNAHYTKNKENFDLIHCAHCLSLNKSPWVTDIEFISQMWGGIKLTNARKKIVKKLLTSKYCKKIIAWTKDTKKGILEYFPELKDKIEVVYYAMPIEKQKKKKNKETTLFFSGRHFYAKGGLHATEVIDRLTKKYPHVKGIINGAIPEEIIKKYSKNKKIKFYQLIPHKEILKIYQNSDIFVYPGYSDSFGFVFIEAMAFGIPIVTVNGPSRQEIIKDEEQGFIISKPKGRIDPYSLVKNKMVINNIIKKVEILINNKKLREKMGKENFKLVKEGKFSIKERNKELREIYKQALK